MNKKNISKNIILLLVNSCLLLLSCNSDYVIKPKGYYKIDFPKHEYTVFDRPGYPYTFEYPVYASIVQDSSFFEDNDTPYWINIDFPRFSGKIYMSYKKVDNIEF